MTLPPERMGDKGQRYQVECLGFPKKDRWHTAGWCDTYDGAVIFAEGIATHPCAISIRVKDRQDNNRVVFNGHSPAKPRTDV